MMKHILTVLENNLPLLEAWSGYGPGQHPLQSNRGRWPGAGTPSCWHHMRDKSCKETSSSKKFAYGPDKISVHDSDIKGLSKYIGLIKVLFHTPHHTFTDQRTWWRFGHIRRGFSRNQ